jgi:hypothetical protein
MFEEDLKENLEKNMVTTFSNEDDFFDFGGLGVFWKIDGQSIGSRFAVVHHPWLPMPWRRRCTAITTRMSIPT